MKLMPHVYQVAGISLSHAYDAAAYLIEGTEGLYLLDCGTPDGFEAIIGNIQKLQFAPEDIRAAMNMLLADESAVSQKNPDEEALANVES